MTWRLDELLTYIHWNEASEFCRREVFGYPCIDIWEECRLDPAEAIQQVAQYLDSFHRSKFIQSCLASYLLDPLRVPLTVKDCLQKFYKQDNFGLPFSWDELVQLNWQSIPIALASQDRALVNRCLISYGHSKDSIFPEDSLLILHKKAKLAIYCAKDLASLRYNTSFFCWPLLAGYRTTIYGSSIGLAVYLGFVSVAEDIQIPKLLATGTIDQSGFVYNAELIDQKAEAAWKNGYKGIICPEDNCLETLHKKGIEILPVNNVDIAWEVWTQFDQGQGDNILYWINSIKYSRLFLSSLVDIPSCMLPWLKKHITRLKERFSFVHCDSSEIDLFVKKLETLLEKPSRNLEKLELISNLLHVSLVDNLGINHPELAWKLCLAKIMLHNHRGQVNAAREWIKQALSYKEILERFEQGDQNVILTYILCLVGKYHNSYTFRPDVLNDFEPFFHKKLKKIQNDYKAEKDKGKKPLWTNIGKFYGTLAQNYGFCGPAYLQEMKDSVYKAIQAFGDFGIPAYKHECLRELSYLFFAYMDAGCFQEAEKTLCSYLEVDKLSAFQPNLNDPYRIFCLFRFQADTGNIVSEHKEWVLSKAMSFRQEHPFQLILYNCGHIFQDLENKQWFWKKSVESCFSAQGGATTYIMALLPLSWLWRYSLSSKEYLEPLVNKAISPVKKGELDKNHFQELLEAQDWTKILDKVFDKKEIFFPFSYR